MSAFGKRSGMSGGRPNFGVAKPMKGGPGAAAVSPSDPEPGGDQFPPLDELTPSADAPEAESAAPKGAAMDRLTARQNASGEAASSKSEGFEASVHRIKEQVLPRLLERGDPEAAATLSKDELAEEFRPIIGEVLAELKITLNRREQFALE
jgi:pilus assembly protein CpaF